MAHNVNARRCVRLMKKWNRMNALMEHEVVEEVEKHTRTHVQCTHSQKRKASIQSARNRPFGVFQPRKDSFGSMPPAPTGNSTLHHRHCQARMVCSRLAARICSW